ncbi:MAG: amidohydrolase [Cytophagales bacterium]|nr:amidohydrolase [Bernardetiaceae bacterium]MDW8203684.1 amidohydrolase [Cytophagales bacterium]
MLLLASLLWSSCRAPQSADWILYNGLCYLPDSTFAEAIAINEGKIVAIGKGSELTARYSASQVLDLQGKLVLPGLHDAHVHPISGAKQAMQCQLSGLNTAAEIRRAIADYVEQHPNEKWILGRGWELHVFPPDGNPSRTFLDSLIPDRPAYFTSWDGHSAWVNSKALQIAGITSATPNPPQGRIEKDSRGQPSGTLREKAMDLVSRLIPADTHEQRVGWLKAAIQKMNQLGITSFIDASAPVAYLKAYETLHQQGALTARVITSLSVGLNGMPPVAVLDSQRKLYTKDEWIRAGAVKIFTDGVPEAHTAALLAPYEDRPNDTGILNYQPNQLRRYCQQLDSAGFQIHFHALGDKAVRVSLDALEGSNPALRHHIAHLQVIDSTDRIRFARQAVIANFQPFWAKGDLLNLNLISRILGPRRARSQYPMASIWRTGAKLAAGSDWPVSTVNPFEAIQVAVTRMQINIPDDRPWIPEERLTLHQILYAYTQGGAYLMQQEHFTGSIAIGKAADLIVLDQNIFNIPPANIHRTRVLLTLVNGKAVHRDGI